MASLTRSPSSYIRAVAAGEDPDAPIAPLRVSDDELARRDRMERGESAKALGQGVANVKSSAYAARGLTRALVTDNEAGALRDFQESQRIAQQAQEEGPEIQNLKDIQGVGDAAAYVRNLGLTQLPNIALAVGTSGAGAAARVGLGSLARGAATRSLARSAATNTAERTVGKIGVEAAFKRSGTELAGDATSEQAKLAAVDALTPALTKRATGLVAAKLGARNIGKEVAQGATVGGVASGTALQASMAPGIVLDEDPNNTATFKERAGVAALGAVGTGSLEALPVIALFKRFGLTGAVNAVASQAAKKGLRATATSVITEGGKQGAIEGATEVAQTIGERAAHKWVNDNVEMMSPEAFSDYINAGVGGFVGGAMFGAPAGLRGAGRGTNGAAIREKLGAKIQSFADRIQEGVDTRKDPIAATATDLGGESEAAANFATVRDRLGNGGVITENSMAMLDEDPDDMSALFDQAQPYESTDIDGTTVIGAQGKVPFANFADRTKAKYWKDQGLSTALSSVASTVPDERVAAMEISGALEAGKLALMGHDLADIDPKALREYRDALPAQAQAHLARTWATFNEMRQKGTVSEDNTAIAVPDTGDIVEPGIEPNELAENFTESDTAQGETLRDPEQYKSLFRGQAVLRPGITPKNAIIVKDAKGKRRPLSGQALGKLITEIQKDQDFQDNTRTLSAGDRLAAAASQVLGDMYQSGYAVETETLGPVTMGDGWKLPESVVKKIQSGLAVDQKKFALQAQSTKSVAKRFKTPKEEAALNKEYGTKQVVDTQRDEGVAAENSRSGGRGAFEGDTLGIGLGKLGPRKGVPRTDADVTIKPGEQAPPATKVIGGRPRADGVATVKYAPQEATKTDGGARYKEGATIDSKDDIDSEAAQAEREKYEPGKFEAIDRLLEGHTRRKVDGDFAKREELYERALSKGKTVLRGDKKVLVKLSAREVAELSDAMSNFDEAQYELALKKWKKNKNPKTLKALKAARAKAAIYSPTAKNRDATGLSRKAAGEVRGPTPTAEQIGRGEGRASPGPTKAEIDAMRERQKARAAALGEGVVTEGSSVTTTVDRATKFAEKMAERQATAKAKALHRKYDRLSEDKTAAYDAHDSAYKAWLAGPESGSKGMPEAQRYWDIYLSEEFEDGPGYKTYAASKKAARDMAEFAEKNIEALRTAPRVLADYMERLDNALASAKGQKRTVDAMALEFEIAVIENRASPTWVEKEIAGKTRRIAKYEAEERFSTDRRLQAIVKQIKKELSILEAGDLNKAVGMNTDVNEEKNGYTIVPRLDTTEGSAQTQDGMADTARRLGAFLGEARQVFADAYSEAREKTADDKLALAMTKSVKALRSRRQLTTMHERMGHMKLSEGVRILFSKALSERYEVLSQEVLASGQKEQQRREQFTHTSAHLSDVWDAVDKAKTVEEALTAVNKFADAGQKRLIRVLLKGRALRDVSFKTALSLGLPEGGVGGSHSGAYGSPIQSAITLTFPVIAGDANNMAMDPIGVLLHESIHGATVFAESTDPEASKAIHQLLDHARSHATAMGIDPGSFYGLSETQEFLAEAFTNPALQDLLKQMPARRTDLFNSLWDEFKGFVARLLGFKTEEASVLDEVFTIGGHMIQTTADARGQAYMSVFGEIDGPGNYITENALLTNSGSQPTDFMFMLPAQERLYLQAAFGRGDIKAEIRKALPADKRHLLDTADDGPTLLVNTGVAMALRGKLDLGPKATSAVRALYNQIRSFLQVPSAQIYANQIIADLKTGVATKKGYSVQERTLNDAALKVTRLVQKHVRPAVRTFAVDVDARMRATGVPALTRLATLLSQRTGEFRGDGQASLTRRVFDERNRRFNALYKVIGGWDKATQTAVQEALATDNKNPPAAIAKQVEQVRAYLKDMHSYLGKAGVKLGNVKDYYPVVLGAEKISANRDKWFELFRSPNFEAPIRSFYGEYVEREIKSIKSKPTLDAADLKQIRWLQNDLKQIKTGDIDELIQRMFLRATGGNFEGQLGQVTFADGEHDPNFKAKNVRASAFVYKLGTPDQIKAFSEFQDDNMQRVLVNYTQRAVRRAEWQRLNLGDEVKALLVRAAAEGATGKQLDMARDYVDQIMGSYGTDWHPMMKRMLETVDKIFDTKLANTDFRKFEFVQTVLVTYQNVRLLPLALASSLIDPLGVMVRSGSPAGAWGAYRDAYKALRNEGGQDAIRGLAEDLGIVERHAVSEALIYMYGGTYDPTGLSAKVNAALFRYNGLEMMTKFSRLAALSMGHRFLIKHSLSTDPRSARYLTELGLVPKDIQIVNGKVLRTPKIDAALTRFVDESVVRPTPAQRPQWQNDPHFMLAAQYKGYLYSFWNVVVRRAALEVQDGNYAVLLPLLMYIPIQAMGEMARDTAQDDGEDEDMLSYATKGFERSGLLGPHINLLSAAKGDIASHNTPLNSIAGPTGQQLANMYDAVGGTRDLGNEVENALPLSALHSKWD